MSFGDRSDRIRVKDIHASNKILIDFKPNRCDAAVYINETLDVTNFVKKIKELKVNNPDITYFHGIAFILAKLLYSRPYLNRFVADRKMYMHKDVSLSFVGLGSPTKPVAPPTKTIGLCPYLASLSHIKNDDKWPIWSESAVGSKPI